MHGGGVFWVGAKGNLTSSTFINNTAINSGGAICWVSVNGTISNSNFTANTAKANGGGVYLNSANCTLTNCNFNGNTASGGGAILWNSAGTNGILTNSTFISNTATNNGGAVHWNGANSNMTDCKFTSNNAVNGDNVYWRWTVDEFLNKYGQINDYDYVYIWNGVGTPNSTIILNKKGITISSQGNVVFDGQGKNLHFEITGSDVLIEYLTFRNFNFTERGGAILWNGTRGILQNCNFNNNKGTYGGAVYWDGTDGVLSACTFINNTAKTYDGVLFAG